MKNQDTQVEFEEPPGHGRPPHPWEDVPLTHWNDWRWQLSHRLNTVEDFVQVIRLTPEEVEGLSTPGLLRVNVTPYFASLMDPDDSTCPIRWQVIPTSRELTPFEAELEDSLAEDAHSPVPGLVHRYPDRVLMLVTTQCASHCRFCTRSRMAGNPHAQFSSVDHERQLAYINGDQLRFQTDAVLGQLGQTGGNGDNGHQPELQIPVLLNTEGER